MKDLIIIMPVYNEEGSIEAVVHKWMVLFRALKIDFELHVYNDGSTDNSKNLLNQLKEKHPELVVHHKLNSGHGPTILQGYCDHSGARWLFQIDSDDELGTTGFSTIWEKRNQYDFLIGTRTGRKAPLTRKLITTVTALTVRLFYGKGIEDVNCPFRLMRTDKFRGLYNQIPSDTFAPNVIISGFVSQAQLRIFQIPIVHHFRQTGEVSIKHWKLLRAAVVSFWQTIHFRYKGQSAQLSTDSKQTRM